jgi:uncharacterized protein (DUF362 family)
MRKEFLFEGQRVIRDEVHTQEEFFDFMSLLPLTPPFIVKPNWISADYGHFTDPEILAWTLGLLGRLGEVVLVESYSARNTMALPDFNPGPMLSETERRRLRESEEDFLSNTGTRRVLDELGIEYVNVTEEVLDGRTVEREIIENAVERRYQPVLREELYSFVPEKLYALRRGTFISLAKFKVFFTMCTKNMFGLILEYVRYGERLETYHGEADKDSAQNIVDINKIYRSIFNVVGIVDGVNSLTCNMGANDAEYKAAFGYRYDVLEDKGLIYYGDDPSWLDAFIHQQCGKDPLEEPHLKIAAQTFGEWPIELIAEARKAENPLKWPCSKWPPEHT